jgi:hypothetical protein
MNPYQTCAAEGASGVELTIALYDGIIRFMFRAIEAVENGDVRQRRLAVKRAFDIVIHLQATLRMDVGGKPRPGAGRVLCGHLCHDAAGVAGKLQRKILARHHAGKECQGCLEAGRQGS